jgi:excisionase family DNA binding protein
VAEIPVAESEVVGVIQPHFQSIPQTADDLGLTQRQTYALAQQGRIPSLRAGGAIRVPRSWVREVIARLERGESVRL